MSAKLYTFLFILLSITSCFNEKKKEKPIVEKSITFPSLKLDKGLATYLNYFVSNNQLYFNEHGFEYFYIGKMKDTIPLHLISFSGLLPPPPPPPPPYNKKKDMDDSSFYQTKIPEHIYYIDWLDNRNYVKGVEKYVQIMIDTSQEIFNNYAVYLTNIDNDTIILSSHQGIRMSIEALDSLNEWKSILAITIKTCGIGLGYIFLPPNECAITLVPIFKGSYKTKFRIKYGKNFSNPYDGFMNYKLFAEIDYNSD